MHPLRAVLTVGAGGRVRLDATLSTSILGPASHLQNLQCGQVWEEGNKLHRHLVARSVEMGGKWSIADSGDRPTCTQSGPEPL
jgi:hypothetical protein